MFLQTLLAHVVSSHTRSAAYSLLVRAVLCMSIQPCVDLFVVLQPLLAHVVSSHVQSAVHGFMFMQFCECLSIGLLNCLCFCILCWRLLSARMPVLLLRACCACDFAVSLQPCADLFVFL